MMKIDEKKIDTLCIGNCSTATTLFKNWLKKAYLSTCTIFGLCESLNPIFSSFTPKLHYINEIF